MIQHIESWAGWSWDQIWLEAKFSVLIQTDPRTHHPPVEWVPEHSGG